MIKDPWISYLELFFLSKETLADECNVTPQLIDQMLIAKAMPQPSYVLTTTFSIESNINSTSEEKSLKISYFPKAIKKWVMFSLNEIEKSGIENAAIKLEEVFRKTYKEELEKRGILNQKEQAESIENTWKHFMLGTYGVCVKDSSEISNIASKQFALKKLIELTDNGKKKDFNNTEKNQVKMAIEEYNKFTAKFGPWEYEKTSRKRLVDDVLVDVLVPNPHLD